MEFKATNVPLAIDVVKTLGEIVIRIGDDAEEESYEDAAGNETDEQVHMT